jgi:hypothetical protein
MFQAAETVMQPASAALEAIARDTVSILEKNNIKLPLLPLLEDVREAAGNALWAVVCEAVVGSICDSIASTVIEDLAVEFRRLCRLDDAYGVVD